MDKKRSVELKVGIFVVIGLVFLAIMIVAFGFRSVEFNEFNYLHVRYQYTNGVVKGAPVRYAGVEVGLVEDIILAHDTNDIILKVTVDKRVQVREDARAIINALGIMGEKYVEIIPRSKETRILKDGEELQGENPTSLSDIFEEGMSLVKKARVDMDKLLSQETIDHVDNILKNIENLTGNDIQEKVNSILNDLDTILDPEVKTRLLDLVAEFKTVSIDTKAFLAHLDSLTQEEIKALITKGKEFLTQANDTAQILKSTIATVQKQEGSIGKFIYTPEFHDKLIQMLDNANKLMIQLKTKGLLYKEEDSSKRSRKEPEKRYS